MGGSRGPRRSQSRARQRRGRERGGAGVEEEAEWQADEDKRAEKAQAKAETGQPTTGDVEDAVRSGEPRFISEVQFLAFKFEPGNYYFVGRETLAGREVLRIEYYPRRLFSDFEKTATTREGPRRAGPSRSRGGRRRAEAPRGDRRRRTSGSSRR